MHNLWISDAMQHGLIVEEIENVLNGKWKGGTAMCSAEDCLNQVVDELLNGA